MHRSSLPMDSSFSTHTQTLEQRRALAEETVSYTVYLAPVSLSTLDRSRDPFSVGLESAKLTKTLVSSIVAELTKDYIWHKDAFSLRADTWDSECMECSNVWTPGVCPSIRRVPLLINIHSACQSCSRFESSLPEGRNQDRGFFG